MKSTLIAALVAPSIALAAVGAGPEVAKGSAYGGAVERLTRAEAAAHAAAVFQRADLDRSGALDADEYAALAIVTAELSRLNGFIALGEDGAVVALPVAKTAALSRGERARVEAVARQAFYVAAGADAKLAAAEFAAAEAAAFDAHDRNGNGRLAQQELSAFAARQAQLAIADA